MSIEQFLIGKPDRVRTLIARRIELDTIRELTIMDRGA
jgi:hypothetical protein